MNAEKGGGSRNLLPECGAAAGLESVRNEWIGLALLAKGGIGSMAGYEADVIPQRPEPLSDGAQQGLVVAAGEVGSANGTLEQYVANLGDPALPVKEYDMAWGMARTVDDFQLLIPQGDLIPIFQPLVRRAFSSVAKTEHLRLLVHVVEPEGILLVWSMDRYAKPLRQLDCATGMIQVAMGEQNHLWFQLQILKDGGQPLTLPARIDDRGCPGVFTPEEGAVLLEGGYGYDFVLHRCKQVPGVE